MAKCFVIMGFGTKTDFQTQRLIDLDTTYNIIKPAVEACDIECTPAAQQETQGDTFSFLLETAQETKREDDFAKALSRFNTLYKTDPATVFANAPESWMADSTREQLDKLQAMP